MNGKYFLYVLLLLAVLTGQMATNAHMIDHMAVAAIDCDFPTSHSENDQHAGHQHNISSLDTSSSDTSEIDCSIYHTYAGVYGLAPADCIDAEIQTKNVILAPPTCLQIVTQTFKAHPIRGPPLHS